MKDFVRTIAFVLTLGTVLTLALTITDSMTADIIARNMELKKKASALTALGIPCTNENVDAMSALTPAESRSEKIARDIDIKIKAGALAALKIVCTDEEVEEAFDQNIISKQENGKTYYVSRNKDIAFEISGSGLWGPISGVLALNKDQRTIKGITIIHQEETPGLGGRISEQDFLDRFKKSVFAPRLSITSAGKAETESEVDGITGATLSCKAFENILNAEYKSNAAALARLSNMNGRE